MFKNIGGLLVIIALGFGWLKAHDHYVKVNALAEARRDSLLLVYSQVSFINDSIQVLQDSLKKESNKLEKNETKLHKQAQKLVTVQAMDESALVKWKDSVQKVIHNNVVDSLINKYDDLILTLKQQIVTNKDLYESANKRAQLADGLYTKEVDKNKKLNDLNAGLRKELSGKKNNNLGKILTNYVLPTVAATVLIIKVTDGRPH